MSDDLLLRLLKAGLLEALGDDDQRRERAEAAAVATGEWLGLAGRPHLASAVVLAIDESGEPDGAAFCYAEQRLLHEWPTLRNVYQERPKELLRAIVLQGVYKTVAADPDLAAATWYVTRTVRDMSISAGRWAPVVEDVIGDIDRAVHERLVEEWAPTMPRSKLRMPRTSPDDAELSEVKSIEQLHEALDPYKSNIGAHYDEVLMVLGEQVPPVLDELAGAVRARLGKGGAMEAIAAALGPDLQELLAQQARIVEASRLREVLLWWRLAGRSELVGVRYGQIEDAATRALAAAGDLHQLCPPVTPEAVEHLLADVVSDADPIEVQLSFDRLAEAWKVLLPSLELANSAGTLIGALGLGEQDALPPAMRRDLTPVEAAVVAFRDLQTARLTAVVPDIESSP